MYLLFIKEMLEKGAVGLLLTLDGIIYWLVGGAYRVFMAVAGARLLSSEAYTQVANKIYIIVGVLMLFVLSYAILRAIVDPDKNLKEELGGKMVQRIVIAVVGLAMAPMIFNLLYKAQGLILDNNIIGNLFFNNEVLDNGEDPDQFVDEIGGYVTATSIWEAFFFPSEDSGKTAAEIKTDPSKYLVGGIIGVAGCVGLGVAAFAVPIAGIFLGAAAAFSCLSAAGNLNNYAKYSDGGEITLEEAYVATAAGENFSIYSAFIDNYVDEGEITYLFIISSIAGGFALYSFISFSIDMGVRAAKMAYLQIVAPIPLIMQVIPKIGQNMWNSYLTSVKDTFLEVFIRVSVVYVVIYIICHLQKLFSNTSALWGNQELSPMVKFLALAILILGLITFCKHAPKIIADTLHLDQAGNVKLGMMDKLREGGALGGAAILGGGLTSAVQGFNKEKFDRNNWASSLAKKVGHGARGLFGGMFQAGKMQMGGNGPKNFRDVRSVASRAAAAEGDKIEHAIDRRDKRREAYKRFKDAQDEVERRRRERDALPDGSKEREAAEKRLAEAKQAARDAWKKVNEFTPQGEWVENRKKRIKIWATGTVDLTLENNAIKFGNSFGSLLDSAREQAYVKKDALSKDWKHRYDELEGKKVSEYRDGWDDESYNEEIRRRIENPKTDKEKAEATTYQKALADYNGIKTQRDSKYTELQTAQAQVVELEAKFQAGEISEADLQSARDSFKKIQEEYAKLVSDTDVAQLNLDSAKKAITDQVDAIAKHSAEEMARLNTELQAQRDAAKKVFEGSSDAFDLKQLFGNDEEMKELVNGTLRQFQELLQDNPNMVVPISLKPDGSYDETTTLYDFVKDLFGEEAAKTGSLSLNPDRLKELFGKAEFVLDTKGTGQRTYTFDAASDTYTGPDGTVYQPGQFYTHINALLEADPKGKFDAMTPIARAKDLGKKMRMAIENSKQRADKIQRQREAESGKEKA